jgi:carbonic anhydrase-like protein
MITSSNSSGEEERGAHSISRCSIAHHGDFRAAPRTNRTRPTADNPGNIAGPLGLASLEYAFDHLGSTVLVVLGHTKCGAVTAACSGEKMPTANLRAMVDQIDPAVRKVKGSATGDALIEAAIKENVHVSATDVQPHYLSSIQLIFRLNYRQLALFFGMLQNLTVRQHMLGLLAPIKRSNVRFMQVNRRSDSPDAQVNQFHKN